MASRTVPMPRRLALPKMRSRSSARTRDRRTVLMLLGSTVMLVTVGLLMVLSASSVSAYEDYGSSFLFFNRQAVYAIVGLAGLAMAARMHYSAWRRLALPLLGICFILLVMVLHPAAGTVAGGSARWLVVGPVTIQPSEIAKLAVVAFAAAVITRKWKRLDEPKQIALPLLPVVGGICFLIVIQPDLGTTVIVAGSVFLLLFVAGVRLRYLATGALISSLLGLVLVMGEGYRRARLLSFLHPWGDPQNGGYQIIQSLIALGSGGFSGVGLGTSRQKWGYVPNAHTDFIFSILGEELGLIGALAVLLLFGVLLYSAVRIAARAPDLFGRLLAAGIASWLGLQTIVNLGAVTGLLPVTGVPLPLVAYGGSSLVVSLTAVGILVNISRESRRAPAGSRKRKR